MYHPHNVSAERERDPLESRVPQPNSLRPAGPRSGWPRGHRSQPQHGTLASHSPTGVT